MTIGLPEACKNKRGETGHSFSRAHTDKLKFVQQVARGRSLGIASQSILKKGVFLDMPHTGRVRDLPETWWNAAHSTAIPTFSETLVNLTLSHSKCFFTKRMIPYQHSNSWSPENYLMNAQQGICNRSPQFSCFTQLSLIHTSFLPAHLDLHNFAVIALTRVLVLSFSCTACFNMLSALLRPKMRNNRPSSAYSSVVFDCPPDRRDEASATEDSLSSSKDGENSPLLPIFAADLGNKPH